IQTGSAQPSNIELDRRVSRSRTVRLIAPPTSGAALNGARLNLFDDAAFELSIDDLQSRSQGSFTASGSIADDPQSQFVIAADDGVIVANLWTSRGEAYQLRPAPHSASYLAAQLDMSRFAGCACGEAQQIHAKPQRFASNPR